MMDRAVLDLPMAQNLKSRLNQLIDEFLVHDGWGHLEVDMRILTRQQKEVIIKAGREFRYVIDFKNTDGAALQR